MNRPVTDDFQLHVLVLWAPGIIEKDKKVSPTSSKTT